MRLDVVLLVGLSMLLCACGNNRLFAKPLIEVEIVNDSAVNLENAEARFGEHICRWGIVVRNKSASYMSYPHPITDRVELHWDSRGHRMHVIDLSNTYMRGKSGRLTFTVSDDRVEAIFRPEL